VICFFSDNALMQLFSSHCNMMTLSNVSYGASHVDIAAVHRLYEQASCSAWFHVNFVSSKLVCLSIQLLICMCCFV